ncbi:MAG: hypothetical protein IJU58_01425 [Clostridia bacterium]|nr:hypothetical protein [Clostridia bacterium]
MALGVVAGMSQMGILEWLKNPISNIVSSFNNLIDVISNLGNLIVTSLSYIVSALLYIIQIGFFWLIDFVQTVFRRVAGLDTYWFRTSDTTITEQSGDIVESLLISDTVWTVFSSVLIAAIILLFVSTFIAILKTELNEKDNAKGPVLKQAFKAIVYFVLVPVVCILGVTLANIFLRTFDSATQLNGPVSISGEIFAASSYNANRVRNGQNIVGDYNDTEGGWGEWATTKKRLTYIDKSPIVKSSSQAAIASYIDDLFLRGGSIGTNSTLGTEVGTFDPTLYEYSYSGYMGGYSYYFRDSKTEHFSSFDKNDITMTYIYYDLLQYNWLIGYLGSFTIIMLLLNLMIGVVQRMFDLTVLFIVSPAFIALMPLDSGQRYSKWREEFVKRTIACYGPIVGINLAFTVLTLAQRIIIFGPTEPMAELFNALMQCIFVITAILCVKDFGKLINSIVGGSDLNENKAGQVRDLMMRGAAAGATGLAMGANLMNDNRKLTGKQRKESAIKRDLDDISDPAKQNDYIDRQTEGKVKDQIKASLLATNPKLKGRKLEKAINKKYNDTSDADVNRLKAANRSAWSSSHDINEEKAKLQDKYDVAQMDVQSAKGSMYSHWVSGKERLQKAGNRAAYMKAWDDAGGKDSVGDIRGVVNDYTSDVGVGVGKHRFKFRTAAGIAGDLGRYDKQNKENKGREAAAKGDDYVRKSGKGHISNNIE